MTEVKSTLSRIEERLGFVPPRVGRGFFVELGHHVFGASAASVLLALDSAALGVRSAVRQRRAPRSTWQLSAAGGVSHGSALRFEATLGYPAKSLFGTGRRTVDPSWVKKVGPAAEGIEAFTLIGSSQ